MLRGATANVSVPGGRNEVVSRCRVCRVGEGVGTSLAEGGRG